MPIPEGTDNKLYILLNVCMGMSMLHAGKDYESTRGAKPRGHCLRYITCSMDTTHTLNDLLLGKPEDESRFLKWCYHNNFELTKRFVKGSGAYKTSSGQCRQRCGWPAQLRTQHSHSSVSLFLQVVLVC